MELREKEYKTASRNRVVQTGTKSVISLPGIEVCVSLRKLFRHQQESPLTETEYNIFLYLLQSPNRVLTYTQIYERIWEEPDYGQARKLVGHHVQAIRHKLNLGKDSGIYLHCIREVGYSLELQ